MQTIIASIILACLAGMALAGPIYVDSWPKRVNVPDGVAHDPTPAQCRAAGYELQANRPNVEIDVEAAQAAVAASNAAVQAAADAAVAASNAAVWQAQQAAHSNRVSALRESYAGTTAQLCAVAGVPPVRVLTMDQLQDIVMPLLDTELSGRVNALLILLTNIEGKLTREDGTDALDRL